MLEVLCRRCKSSHSCWKRVRVVPDWSGTKFSSYFQCPLHFLSAKGAWSSALILLRAASLVCLHGGHRGLRTSSPSAVPARVVGAHSLGTDGAGGNIGRVPTAAPRWCGFASGMWGVVGFSPADIWMREAGLVPGRGAGAPGGNRCPVLPGPACCGM